jgi:hypothetical protein
MRRLILLNWLLLSYPVLAQEFNNQAFARGLFFSQPNALYGGGVSFMDFDRDGDDDITLTQVGAFPFIYRNTGIDFQLEYQQIAVDHEVKQANWVDYDNDGLLDLVMTLYQGPMRFFRNTGNLVFEETTDEVGIPATQWETFGNTWADYDRDGDLDVYVANYNGPGYGQVGIENFLYSNNGDGTFTDVTAIAGVGDGVSYSFMAIWMYINDDMWPDLYVSNDRYESENSMYINNGDGTFTDVSESSNTNVAVFSMGLAAEDFDNDGDEDIYISNWQQNLLFVNDSGVFQDMAAGYGVLGGQYTWGCMMADFDNDMHKDLFFSSAPHFQSNGTNQLYRNTGEGFVNITYAAGMGNEFGKSYGCALGDINNDGHMDIVTIDGEPTYSGLWVNQGTNNHWLKVEMHGIQSNKDAIGAKIYCYAGGVQQMNVHRLGESYLSQFSNREHFGLGQQTMVDSLVVHWPSGVIDRHYRFAVDQTLQLYEGQTFLGQINAGENVIWCPNAVVQLTVTSPFFGDVLWSNGEVADTLEVFDAGSYSAIINDVYGNAYHSNEVSVAFHAAWNVAYELLEYTCFGDTATLFIPSSEQWASAQINDTAVDIGVEVVLPFGWNRVTITDVWGCEAEDSLLVQSFTPIVGIVNVDDVVCPGQNNGAVEVQLTGGTPPYLWLSGANVWSDLTAGEYSLAIQDANGCIWQEDVVVEEPELPVPSFVITPPTCFGFNNGTIDIEWSGSLAGYQLTTSWLDNQEVIAGDHWIQLVDFNGCEVEYSIQVEEPEPLQLFYQVQPSIEGQSNGAIQLIPSGGTPPYTYWWNSGQGNVSSISELVAGNYFVQLTDANGCSISTTIVVTSIVNVLERSGGQLFCYPNPVQDYLYVHGNVEDLEFYDSTGRRIFAYPLQRGVFDLKNFPNGIYHLRGRINDQLVSTTIVKSP